VNPRFASSASGPVIAKTMPAAFLAPELPPKSSSTLACLRQLARKVYPGSRESLGSLELRIEQADAALIAIRFEIWSCACSLMHAHDYEGGCIR
jgi:hypothetical protein